MNASAFMETLRALSRRQGPIGAATDPTLTPAQVVTRWNQAYSVGTLANWRVLNAGPAFVKVAGRVLYPLRNIEEFERARLAECANV